MTQAVMPTRSQPGDESAQASISNPPPLPKFKPATPAICATAIRTKPGRHDV
jgi:hypothetical protein